MKSLNVLLLSVMTVFSLACSFGSGGNSGAKANIEDRERFMQEYAAVFGVYEGSISNQPNQKVEISIYSIEVPKGSDEKGRDLTKPVAKARMRWIDSSQSDLYFNVSYFAETADLKMTSETTPAVVFSGKINGGSLSGVVTRGGGNLGMLTATLNSRTPTAPPEGDAREKNERLRRLYRPLVGEYTAIVKFSAPAKDSYKFYLRLYIDEMPINEVTLPGSPPSDEKTYPVLLAFYQRADYPKGELTLTFDCDYITTTTPPALTMVSRPAAGIPNNTYKFTLNTRVKGNIIEGTMSDLHHGRTGQVTIIKNSNSAAPAKAKPKR